MIANAALKADVMRQMQIACPNGAADWNQDKAAILWVKIAAQIAEECGADKAAFIRGFAPYALCEGAGFCNASQAKQACWPESKKAGQQAKAMDSYLASLGIAEDEPKAEDKPKGE